MSKTIEEIIEDYTKERISGVTDFNEMIDKSLFQPIEHVKNIAGRYATVKTQELKEQNEELFEMLSLVCMDLEERGRAYGDVYTMPKEILIKYKHLNKKP